MNGKTDESVKEHRSNYCGMREQLNRGKRRLDLLPHPGWDSDYFWYCVGRRHVLLTGNTSAPSPGRQEG